MNRFFTRERFGHPQFIAGLFLLAFLAQAGWLTSRKAPTEVDATELFRIHEGWAQLQRQGIAGTPSDARLEAGVTLPSEVETNEGYDPNHSPLWYLLAAAPMAGWAGPGHGEDWVVRSWGWLSAAPYLLLGIALGASLWYVSRRLYGNQGGYTALTLYCFSPGILQASALWHVQPEIGAAWGSFGAVFTSIAVAHTLYAPREVVLWNWRRTLLLGLSFALAIGCQFSLVVLAPLGLGFMLYLAPDRRRAAASILTTSLVIAFFLLYAAYGFHLGVMWQSLRHANFVVFESKSFALAGGYRQLIAQFGLASPVALLAFPAGLFAYALWPRTRYFGNSAPLLVVAVCVLLALANPQYPGMGFLLVGLPFVFVFIAGIAADLLETADRKLVQGCIWSLLVVSSAWNVWQLLHV